MTIGFDASRAFVEGKTGTENYSFQLLKALAKIDGSTSLTTGTENSYLIYIKKSQKSKVKSQKWPDNFKFQILNFKFLWTQVGLAFRTWFDPLDVLFVPSHTLPLLKKPGLKTVLTVHDLGAEYLPAFHQLKQVVYLNLMTHHQLKSATKLIAVSEATKKDIIQRVKGKGLSIKGKIEVVYEGVDKTIFKPMFKDAVNDIVKKYDVERGKYFLFVGTIQPRKNLERLIRAFAMFKGVKETKGIKERNGIKGVKGETGSNSTSNINVLNPINPINFLNPFKLVLAGQKGWKSDEIYNLPKQLGIEDKVVFTGRISDQDLVGLYNGATALTYASLFEGFGLPIIEAFACGCPVITSNLSSMPEVAENAAILVDPYNIEEISKAMQGISYDETLRSSFIKKGRVRSDQFDWGRCARETLLVIDGVKETKAIKGVKEEVR